MKVLRIVLVLSFSTILLFGILYPLAIVGVGKFMPENANGFPIERDGQLVGFENIGQSFSSPQYFWGRPSAVGYDASSTGGSNFGPTNPEFLQLVQQRIDTLLHYHPNLKTSEIPTELVTASGSGIDPHISQSGARIQIERVAQARNLPLAEVQHLVEEYTTNSSLGPKDRVNVLQLNLALDELSNR